MACCSGVDEMVKNPDSYSMKAANKGLTVMFCNMNGFTKMSERMAPIDLQGQLSSESATELKTWGAFVPAYRAQDWDHSDVLLLNLLRANAKKYLYQLYAMRIASIRMRAYDATWNGAINFQTK